MADSPASALVLLALLDRLEGLEQVIRDINWSLVFDVLPYETFTPHAREVLAQAPALLTAARRGAETMQEQEQQH